MNRHQFLLLLGSADDERSDIVASGLVVLGMRAIAGGESARQPASAVNALLACLEDPRDRERKETIGFSEQISNAQTIKYFALPLQTYSLLTTLGESRSMRPLIFPGPSTDSAMLRAELRAAWRGRGAKAEAEAQRERAAMVFIMNLLGRVAVAGVAKLWREPALVFMEWLHRLPAFLAAMSQSHTLSAGSFRRKEMVSIR